MQAQSYPLKPKIMGVDVIKQQLIERIENGDEQFVRVLFAVSNALEENETEAFDVAAYEASLKPMTVEELIARAEESNRAIEVGDYVDIEEALAEMDE